MNILLIGGGGREHTMAWKLKQSNLCSELFIIPGNAGTAELGTNLNFSITDFDSIATAALKHDVKMVIVGPEEPLVKGITDYFSSHNDLKNILVIGPSKEASQLEGSKAFAKSFMQRHSIPTASYKEFTSKTFKEGCDYIRQQPLPIVLKADGLAAGKGVLICNSHMEAQAEFELMVMHSKFGKAGEKVVIEAFLQGIEMSVFVLTDGKNYVLLPEAKDYKRIGLGDTGLNTGGMGAVSPVPLFDEPLKKRVIETIVEPTISGLQEEKFNYKGFVFFGLMVKDGEPWVIEYNCRMGDPETEVVLPRMKNDLVELLLAAGNGKLSDVNIEATSKSAATVVAVSGGYPGNYEKNIPVHGLNNPVPEGSILFHAGTKTLGENVVTNGGRVMAMTSFGENITEAVEQSVYAIEQLHFEGMYFRPDIGFEFREENATNGKA
ncbi:MAG: phosphoribosylamine--glycine ligase [Chitinophagaceae bacterium]|nr:MAG: phosphoribosylamine--glycine ligase [Chitinophagaceae bacterium]